MNRGIKLLIAALSIVILLALLASLDSERPTKRIEKPVTINAQ